MTRILVVGVVVAVVGGGAYAIVQATQSPNDGAGAVAFVMTLTEAQCKGEGVACFQGTMKNLGSKEGSGTCWVEGFSNESELRTKGPQFTATLKSGEIKGVDVVWDLPPEENYAGNCDPSPVG